MAFSTVSLPVLAGILTAAGLVVSTPDAWGRVVVSTPGTVDPRTRGNGAIMVTVDGSGVDNRFTLRSDTSVVSEATETAAATTVAKWLGR